MASSSTGLQPATSLDGATSPRTLAQKGVTIYDEPEHIAPRKPEDQNGASPGLPPTQSPRAHRASISGKKLTGRPQLPQAASTASLSSQMPYLSLADSDPGMVTPGDNKSADVRALLSQVNDWLKQEKEKQEKRHRPHSQQQQQQQQQQLPESDVPDEGPDGALTLQRESSREYQPDLDKLDSILKQFDAGTAHKLLRKSSSGLLRKGSIAKKFKRKGHVAAQSSDTEFFGDDVLVPNVEASLDNSKTMAFTGGGPDTDTSENAKRRDHEHWLTFKREILRLTHTLKLKGWRRVPIEKASDINVKRMSGALTNAVYVVNLDKNVSDYISASDSSSTAPGPPVIKSKPVPLLLRIYGPQVEHLIDRNSELAILRRLSSKRIGPRLLGTFNNGRFEEFLHAKTLTPNDLRVPETSKQIAKRMRELHEGIDLTLNELEQGPTVFLNWNNWVDRVEKVICWLDDLVKKREAGDTTIKDRYTRHGFICGVEWPRFRKAYEDYRKVLIEECGGQSGIREMLVFAHNDTQYGNLMRLQPSGTSPLLQPANHHRQLVVIDFEYAGPNPPGVEFANHFTEWCYNYHDPEHSYVCNARAYPDEKAQYQFIRSYVMHRVQFAPAASETPKFEGREKTMIGDFMLDARAPGGTNTPGGNIYEQEENEREKRQEEEIQKLLRQTRLWRIANHVLWIAWGIVQAKVPELDQMLEEQKRKTSLRGALGGVVKGILGKKDHHHEGSAKPMSDPLDEEVKARQEESKHDRPEGRAQEEAHNEGNDVVAKENGVTDDDGSNEEEEEFDYLAYAQDRTMFFWGDCLQMGLVKEEELPEKMKKMIKFVRN